MRKGKGNTTPEEEKLLDLMVELIEKFEEEHYPIGPSTPLRMLKHVMEARDLKPKDLWPVFGSKGLTSDVLSGTRQISKAKAKALAEFFKVSVELFVCYAARPAR